MGGSLIGSSAGDARRWADWYRKQRKLTWVTVDQLILVALQEQGITLRVTKTALRRAAKRLLRDSGQAQRQTA
jgi:hypothetical protein